MQCRRCGKPAPAAATVGAAVHFGWWMEGQASSPHSPRQGWLKWCVAAQGQAGRPARNREAAVWWEAAVRRSPVVASLRPLPESGLTALRTGCVPHGPLQAGPCAFASNAQAGGQARRRTRLAHLRRLSRPGRWSCMVGEEQWRREMSQSLPGPPVRASLCSAGLCACQRASCSLAFRILRPERIRCARTLGALVPAQRRT